MSLSDVSRFVRCNVPLAMYSRLQLGGKAEFFAEPETETDLTALLRYCSEKQIPVHVLGTGANILVPDDGVAGLTLVLSRPAFNNIIVDGQRITAGGGTKFGQIITQSVVSGLGGIEGLIGIPGTFGGVLSGNSGTNAAGDIGQWVESVCIADFSGCTSDIPRRDITFAYRDSSLDDAVILSATLHLDRDAPKELAKRMQKIWIVRKTQQPTGELPSIYPFKNPAGGVNAGDLIDQAGLRGTKVGGANVSERNAGFIVVKPDCSSNDVVRLIRLIKDEVANLTEIELETALQIW
ncbi:MAG: UDP-N-acetylmuramate dehydrogenase [Planctomycetaceae bacterium]|jgi:UDP-N-acetylmuramate dehydrogenase|nr:UDP-N-acetylmuramate dehydrogenase [Planctomycetaceae bacterium]